MKLSAYANKNLLQGDIVRTQPYSTLQLLTAKGTFIKQHGVFRGWPKTQVITCFTLHHKKQIKIAMPISRFLALIPLINFRFLVLFPSKCFNRSLLVTFLKPWSKSERINCTLGKVTMYIYVHRPYPQDSIKIKATYVNQPSFQGSICQDNRILYSRFVRWNNV